MILCLDSLSFREFPNQGALKKLKYNMYSMISINSSVLNHWIIRAKLYSRDCKSNSKWPSMQRWCCPIHNDTNEAFIWLIMWEILSFYLSENYQFSKFYRHWYLINTWLDNAFKSTIVTRGLPFLHGGSHKITLTDL